VTHDYTSLVACKNNFLIGTAKLAKKHGVKSLVALCPVEHDLAYTEIDAKTWIEVRHEAEQSALNENKHLTILNTDLVYSDKPTHLIHYIAQRVAKGSIAAPFLSDATFKPISSEDEATAVAHKLLNGGHGHFALRGDKELTIK
jgi:dTDP-4-dehydrorhamnose reductase